MTSLAFIGTQGEAPGQGIHAVLVDDTTGALTDLGVVAEEERPTFVLADPRRPVLYAVSEVGNRDERFGAIMSYRITDKNGTLEPLSRRRTGGGPTHLVMSAETDMLYCANFGGPHAVALPVDDDGRLGAISAVMETEGTGPHRRQTKPHPHGVTLDPTGGFLLVPDMGADRIFVYQVDGRQLRPNTPACLGLNAGCGPRFVAFGAHAQYAYMVAELSAEVMQLGWDAETGTLTHIETVALDAPGAEHAPGAAAFGISRDGRSLYVSNRGSHEMHVFAIDPTSGGLTETQRLSSSGEKPWGLGICPRDRFMLVANQATGTLACFEIATDTGALSPTGHSVAIDTPTSASFVGSDIISRLG